ncbi:DUF397 domain-containing protein [Actinomadura sp. SCN-SB]|uniref:DUF397 domain-containing protein n=1 Tax=Actinomadura sp. SCN-SB TaxID=3373092 RepID=UPI003751BAB3
MSNATWRESSHSTSSGGNRVELADAAGMVAVRDSKDPDGPVLLLTRAALRTAVHSAISKRRPPGTPAPPTTDQRRVARPRTRTTRRTPTGTTSRPHANPGKPHSRALTEDMSRDQRC